jgi:hypothetical protein
MLPGQIVAAVLVEPGQERGGEGVDGGWLVLALALFSAREKVARSAG